MGSRYEKEAADYLRRQGYEILVMNYRNRKGEIDIVARDGDYLCFVEVKYRKDAAAGDPLEAKADGHLSGGGSFPFDAQTVGRSTDPL